MNTYESLLRQFGLELPNEPQEVRMLANGPTHYYRYEDTDVLIPQAMDAYMHRPNANKALAQAVNIAQNVDMLAVGEDLLAADNPLYIDMCQQNETELLPTAHGVDEVQRFREMSLIKSNDHAALLRVFETHNAKRPTITAIFGESAVLLCNVKLSGHTQLLERIKSQPAI